MNTTNIALENEFTRVQSPLSAADCASLSAGNMVLLSGEVFTARDAAHRRMADALRKGDPLPFDLSSATLFYAAPSPTPPGRITGSIGPTTSYRMDAFTPMLIERGLKAMIGKGSRSPEVVEAIKKYQSVYFGAIGGIAALTARCIKSMETVAYQDLGPEAIRKLTIIDLPLVVINDSQGGDLYLSEQSKWRIILK